jgi:hypothetical protein
MALIFESSEELKKFATGFSEHSLNFPDYEPDAVVVQDYYLRKVLGDVTLDALIAAYESNTPLANNDLLLWEKSMPVVANLTLYHFMPSIYSILSSGGDRTTSTEQAERSPLWSFRQKREEYLMKGMRAIDALYLFLEKNIDDFNDWATSTAYTEFKKYFVNTTALFNDCVRIANSRNTFLQLIPDMATVEELTMKVALGDDYFDELKEKFIDDDLSNDEVKVVAFLQKAIANLTMARAANQLTFKFMTEGIVSISTLNSTADQKENEAKDSKVERYIEICAADGQAYLQRAIDELNMNASETVFTTWYESDKYVSATARTTVRTPDYGNSGKGGSFFFGGK